MIDLKKYREELGLTPSAFAKKTGISRQHVWDYEQEGSKRKISLEKKIDALRACGCEVEIIITLPSPRPQEKG